MSERGPLQLELSIGPDAMRLKSNPGADADIDDSLPLGATTLVRHVLQHAPPRPLEIEQAIELVEEVIMPARSRWPETLALRVSGSVWREFVVNELQPATDDPSLPLWLGIEDAESLFSRLVARAEGRSTAQDDIPVDGARAAHLIILREILHHWQLSGVWLNV